MATKLLEQAVSILMLVPQKLKNQLTLLAFRVVVIPVAAYGAESSRSLRYMSL